MENLSEFIGLLIIWGGVYMGYVISMRRYQEGE